MIVSLIGRNLYHSHKYEFERIWFSSVQLHLVYRLYFAIFGKNITKLPEHLKEFPAFLPAFLPPAFLPSLLFSAEN